MPALEAARRTVWNGDTYRVVQAHIRRFGPDVIHAHNTFPLVSPALYYAADNAGVPVVQTLHNYRLICPAATLYRNGHVCEDCVGKMVPYGGVLHHCYRTSIGASATVGLMLTAHRFLRTYDRKIERYIALTEFTRKKFEAGGLPANKFVVKPNFLADDPGEGTGSGRYALFAGRLSEEKGLRTLLDAWSGLSELPLKIAGDGPLRPYVQARSAGRSHIELLGHLGREQLWDCLKAARFLVVPSEWYEGGQPMVVLEAIACGTPVLASDIGCLREVIREGVNGARFSPGNSVELVSRVRHLITNISDYRAFRRATRQDFRIKYTAERNFQLLRGIYADAIAARASRARTASVS
jgi:glycosyltransferase involved in cell wall biosynthesis